VGDPGAFGASVGVVNAFDGLRHLMELLEHVEERFKSVPYADLVVDRVKKINGSLVSLTSSDPWATETTELRRLIGATQNNLVLLRDKSVTPLVAMCNYYTDRGHSVPDNKLQAAIVELQHQISAMGPPAGSGTFGRSVASAHNQPAIDNQVSLEALEARMAAVESKNAAVEADVLVLRANQPPPGYFRGTQLWRQLASRSRGGGASGGQGGVPPQFFDNVRDMHVRLNNPEAFLSTMASNHDRDAHLPERQGLRDFHPPGSSGRYPQHLLV
jgi:hypothetical protein